MPIDAEKDESGPSEEGAAEFDAKKVAEIAKLARLQFDEGEVSAVKDSLTMILKFIDQVREADVEGYPPTISLISVIDSSEDMVNPMNASHSKNEDKVTDGGYPDRILANAPESREGFFVVPKVVE